MGSGRLSVTATDKGNSAADFPPLRLIDTHSAVDRLKSTSGRVQVNLGIHFLLRQHFGLLMLKL